MIPISGTPQEIAHALAVFDASLLGGPYFYALRVLGDSPGCRFLSIVRGATSPPEGWHDYDRLGRQSLHFEIHVRQYFSTYFPAMVKPLE